MTRYSKGARYERELLHFLNSRKFSCARVAASGGYLSPVDIIAIKKSLVLGFEIKAWNRKPRLEKIKLRQFKEWCNKAGALGFLAWRKRKEWLFLRIEDAEKNQYGDENWINMENFLRAINPTLTQNV